VWRVPTRPLLPLPDHAGYYVARKAGWTPWLPVEVEVEKRSASLKRQIEDEVGIAEFTRLCRESVLSYVDDWRALTERIGYWVDLDAATDFDSSYVESVCGTSRGSSSRASSMRT